MPAPLNLISGSAPGVGDDEIKSWLGEMGIGREDVDERFDKMFVTESELSSYVAKIQLEMLAAGGKLATPLAIDASLDNFELHAFRVAFSNGAFKIFAETLNASPTVGRQGKLYTANNNGC
ncbi:hypothetical protein Tco_1129704 [Tanacetum coccineum]